ncbi:MAG: hypothetical protein VX185_02600 [Pseudomonadota bacterium]|nr:hypothetical protein [Pseudomonadota bacterium]
MMDWDITSWLLFLGGKSLFLAVVILSVLLFIAKSRISRLQQEFHKLAESIGDILASEMNNPRAQLESLIVQADAYFNSQGVSSWNEIDPKDYPDLLPLFFRSAVLQIELNLLDHPDPSHYWYDLTQRYDNLIFTYGQYFERIANVKKHDVEEDVVEAQRQRILELENMVRSFRHKISDLQLSDEASEVIESELAEVESRLMQDLQMESTSHFVDRNIAMLNNIIDDQQRRIKALELANRSAEPRGEEQLGANTNNEEYLQSLQAKVDLLEKQIQGKDQEIAQLCMQFEMLEGQSDNPGVFQSDSEDDVCRALISAWAHAEESLSVLEQRVLKYNQ